jgi:hypothetical protein
MKTLGATMGKCLILIIFKIALVLFIVLTAIQLAGVTLVENISGVSARKREQVEKVNQNLIGKNITDHVQNSKKM